MSTPFEETYESLRPLVFSVAYRMLGSVSEAEDVVQETLLRVHVVAGREEIHSPEAYATTMATRLCIDALRSARVRRESYVGDWLPEPLLGDAGVGPAPMPDAAEHAETADSLSMAFLVLLETLSPVERAAFLLREVFGYDYSEIAAVVDKSEVACRQLVSRARARVNERKPRFEASRRRRDELASRFFAACEEGDLPSFIDLLAADVVFTGDGGGKVPPGFAISRPIFGRERVARLLAGFSKRLDGLLFEQVVVNGQPGALLRHPAGAIISVLSLDIAEGQVCGVRSVVNPEKLGHLGHLGPVGDLEHLTPQAATPGPYRAGVMHPTGAAFRAAIEQGDHAKASALLADDVTFHSPIVHRTYVGRDAVAPVLAAVSQVFEDFRYTGEHTSPDGAVLVFAARIGDRDIEGIDMFRFAGDDAGDKAGQIVDFTVMVRPYSGATALRDRMAALLG
ncbi:MAG TPA: RNA polymerase sigma-70 factor [Frankiaceae bacterium]|jgi:RNA polymerase sigma-70 factor (ECF subfamily)|nr:RNA polymerase sigma-70 factor [Frankiaceae bacterium]